MDRAYRELDRAITDLAARVDETEKWVETLRGCVEVGTQTSTTHQERHAILNERLDTLSARLDVLQPHEDKLVPCPACTEGLVFTPGDADDPPSHDHCELCGGLGEVPEGVAAYVGRLQNEVGRLRRLPTPEDLKGPTETREAKTAREGRWENHKEMAYGS